ncbi:MAG: GIY-YIG nuclease family protein [Candidatus Thorarchaeota archaeon]|jgi:sugar fermentation stimulation protein A
MKGVYALVVSVDEPITIDAGSLGRVAIHEGTWIYVGSAMGEGSTSLENRIGRHLATGKTIHWHIDYLLERASVTRIFFAETHDKLECTLASAILKSSSFDTGPKGFGSSDCQSDCGSHLFSYRGAAQVSDDIAKTFRSIRLEPREWNIS